MEGKAHRPAWKTLLAFAIIYFVWGSTFLGIRVGVREVPPLVFAAMRFFTAGAILFGWMLAKGEPVPNRRGWVSGLGVGVMVFFVGFGLLFLAGARGALGG